MSDTEEEHTVDYSQLKKVLTAAAYDEICQFIRDYPGLAIDCEIDMVRNQFKHINPFTIKWIMQIELANRQRTLYWSYDQLARNILERFEAEKWHCDSTFLLRMASVERISPVLLCRLILKEMFPEYSKTEITDALKFPREKIEDPLLATNILNCVVSDSQDGALVDMRRRLVGEEYELKLKQMAKAAGLHFKDEHDLRRIGYDKTPDIRMVLPFLYKGEIVWWMESKAVFGDIATHMSYVEQQLKSYNNRFSNGIIIYWFGYHEQVPELTDKSLGVTILDDFPAQEHITLLDVKLLDVKPEDIKKFKDVKKDGNEKDVEINDANDAKKANQASTSGSQLSKIREKLSGLTVLDKVSNTPKYMTNEEFNEAGPILSADVEAKSDGKREPVSDEKITAENESKPEEKEETIAKA